LLSVGWPQRSERHGLKKEGGKVGKKKTHFLTFMLFRRSAPESTEEGKRAG